MIHFLLKIVGNLLTEYDMSLKVSYRRLQFFNYRTYYWTKYKVSDESSKIHSKNEIFLSDSRFRYNKILSNLFNWLEK